MNPRPKKLVLKTIFLNSYRSYRILEERAMGGLEGFCGRLEGRGEGRPRNGILDSERGSSPVPDPDPDGQGEPGTDKVIIRLAQGAGSRHTCCLFPVCCFGLFLILGGIWEL